MKVHAPRHGALAVFPPPGTQETPRLRFVGELRGETDFTPKDGGSGRSAVRE